MTDQTDYKPGPGDLAHVEKDGNDWALVLVKGLRHPPEKVWVALTDPAQLREWAPFDSDTTLGAVGPVKLSTVGTPTVYVTETEVTIADAPSLLEYKWGGSDMRWKLEPSNEGTRLTLWTKIDRRYISWGAAGWHICLDVLERLVDGSPIGRIVGPDAMKFDWRRLNQEYSDQFGFDTLS